MKQRNYLLVLLAAAVITACTDASQISAPPSFSEDNASQVNPQWDWDGIGIATGCPGCGPPPGGCEPQGGGEEGEVGVANDPCEPSGPGGPDGYADDGWLSGTGDCPTCEAHDSSHRQKYDQALQQIDQQRCPELYAKAVEYASTFKVWYMERLYTHPVTGQTRRILGEWLPYGELAGQPQEPTTAAFWETHLVHGTQFPITVAHEAAHGIGYSDMNNQAEIYARSCMK